MIFWGEKTLPLIKWVTFSLIVSGYLLINDSKLMVEATKISSSHIGTFEGNTTFIATSENEVAPELFIEVMDRKGDLTQYKSKNGHLTIPNTHEGTYVTQAKLLGKTKYKDIATGEILDEWEDGRTLELVSVENPTVKIVGKNLFDSTNIIPNKYINDENYNFSITDNDYHDLLVYNSLGNETITVSTQSAKLGYGRWENTKGELIKRVYSYNQAQTSTTSPDGASVLKITLPKNIKDIQIEKSSIATTYTPYQSNLITFEEDIALKSVGEVQDELDLMTGNLKQKVKNVLLNGGEDWETNSNAYLNAYTFQYLLNDAKPIIVSKDRLSSILCDKFPTIENFNVNNDNKGVFIST